MILMHGFRRDGVIHPPAGSCADADSEAEGEGFD